MPSSKDEVQDEVAALVCAIELGIMCEERSPRSSIKPGVLSREEIEWLAYWLLSEGVQPDPMQINKMTKLRLEREAGQVMPFDGMKPNAVIARRTKEEREAREKDWMGPKPSKHKDGEMYRRPHFGDGFPNPFTPEYEEGYSLCMTTAGCAPIGEIDGLVPTGRIGYQDAFQTLCQQEALWA